MSTVAAYKAELVAVLTAGLPTVQVVYGPAADVTTLGPDVLVVGNVTGSTAPGSLARGSLVRRGVQESYDVALTVSCSRPGPDSQATATAAAFAFRDAAETVLIAAIPVTVGVLSAQVTGVFELLEDDSPSATVQRNAAVTFSVHVEAST
jgi:hypothetical protein